MVNFEHDATEHKLVCRFPARLDTPACQVIQEQIAEKINILKAAGDVSTTPVDTVVFDLQEVTYISSSFIRICMFTAQQLPKGGFSIIHCDPFVKKTFKIAGLDELLNIS